MSRYLCYDIRGIQSFIFRIPKLKYIVGGSALIDRFDRETVPSLVRTLASELAGQIEYIYSAGGKGAFFCNVDEDIDVLQTSLIKEAHTIGLDIRFGDNSSYSDAALKATRLYPFVPESLEGEPCPVSGLYPVKNHGKVHPIIQKRLYSKKQKMYRWFEERLLEAAMDIPRELEGRIDFFHNVDIVDNEDGDFSGIEGARALGSRNRWAIICMDGNDMGMQFRDKNSQGLSESELIEWVKKMSGALDECAFAAASRAIGKVVYNWAKDNPELTKNERVIVPIRPLVVGGDDITVLCHSSYARLFVNEAIRVFNETSKVKQKEAGIDLWCATGGELTISAGILYCSVSLPLHSAIGYAESLLASAKFRGRQFSQPGKPAPAALDWENVTDSVVDTPAMRRHRELLFKDGDIDRLISLTCRPFLVSDFHEVENLACDYKKKEIPRTILHRILPKLRQGYFDRLAFIAELTKHQPLLAGHLSEYPLEKFPPESKWEYNSEQKIQSTIVFDAISMLMEEQRMEKETAHDNN